MPSKGTICALNPEIGVSKEDMIDGTYPVASREITRRNGEIEIHSNFEGSIIQNIWKLDPEIAARYIYIDKNLLESIYPDIRETYNSREFPFAFLNSHEVMPESKWKKEQKKVLHLEYDKNRGTLAKEKLPLNSEILVRLNGGWVVNEGGDYLHPTAGGGVTVKQNKVCGNLFKTDPEERVKACQLLSILASLQNQKGFNSRTPSGTIKGMKRKGDDLEIKIDEELVSEQVRNLSPDPPEYRLTIFLDPNVTYWVRTRDPSKIKSAIKSVANEFASSVTEKKVSKNVKDYSELKRYSANVFDNGGSPEGVINEFPFLPNPVKIELEPDDYFVKGDFMKEGNGINENCSDLGAVTLLDHDGNFVPFLITKKKRKKVIDVVKKTDPKLLSKWKWACLSAREPRAGESIVPMKIKPGRRSVTSGVIKGGKITVSKDDIMKSVDEIALVSWNAIARSRMNSRAYEIEGGITPEEDLDSISGEIWREMDTVTGGKNVNYFKNIYSSGIKEPIVVSVDPDEKKVLDSPILKMDSGKFQEEYGLGKKKYDDKTGKLLTGKLSRFLKIIHDKETIIGVEDDLEKLFEKC